MASAWGLIAVYCCHKFSKNSSTACIIYRILKGQNYNQKA
jgi:hypothetical protein